MKKFSLIQIRLLERIADGLCHSGVQLGAYLNVSRTAVWKQINQLIELGVPILSIPQQGYQLQKPLIFLNESSIYEGLLLQQDRFNIHLFAALDSTSHYLKTLPHTKKIEVCCSESQTQGRGRFGRHWHSPFGENIYCSSRWYFNYDISRLSGLSLVVSLAILNVLKTLSLPPILIKWPNDIYCLDKKISGTLIEISGESHSNSLVIIGIGLNVNLIDDQPWSSLAKLAGHSFNRNQLIAKLLTELSKQIETFSIHGFPAFQDAWNQVDYLKDKVITVAHPSGKISGIAQGVDEFGQLILTDSSGTKHFLASGDTTLRV